MVKNDNLKVEAGVCFLEREGHKDEVDGDRKVALIESMHILYFVYDRTSIQLRQTNLNNKG